jgi:predicted Zn-dependent protease
MKRCGYVGTIAALTVAVVIAATAVEPAGAAAGWTQFRHPQLGFRVSYPAGWETLTGNSSTAWIGIGPHAESTQRFRLNVVVVSVRTRSGATIEEAHGQLERALMRPGETTRVLRTDQADLGEHPALLTYVTRRTATGVYLYQMIMITMHYRRGYAIVGSTIATSTKVAAETQLLQQVLLSFRPQ